MNFKRNKLAAALLVSTALLSGCGGGGGGGSDAAGDPTDPGNPGNPGNPGTSASNLEQVKAPAAWALGYTGEGVTVAVIDGGVRVTHEAFAGAITTTYNSEHKTADVTDHTGHGTHVAGIAVGSVGVAPDATLLPIKSRDGSDGGAMEAVAEAINFATANGVKIINLSQKLNVDPISSCEGETYGCDGGVTDALFNYTANGGLVIVAAGNDGSPDPQGLGFYANDPDYHGNVIVVGAVDWTNQMMDMGSWASSRAGARADVFLVAPGGASSAAHTSDDGYTYKSGTSMAAPHVAGAAAIVWQKNPSWTAHQVRDALFNSATDLGDPGVDATFGHGLLNIQAAVQ